MNRGSAEGDSFHPNPAANLVGDRKSFWLVQPRGSFVVNRTLSRHCHHLRRAIALLSQRLRSRSLPRYAHSPGFGFPIARWFGESALLLNAPPVRTTPHRPFPPRAGVGLTPRSDSSNSQRSESSKGPSMARATAALELSSLRQDWRSGDRSRQRTKFSRNTTGSVRRILYLGGLTHSHGPLRRRRRVPHDKGLLESWLRAVKALAAPPVAPRMRRRAPPAGVTAIAH